ncbi:MAG: glycosyltransferase family 4 protein [Desulfurococcaceae archaeon]
MSDKTLVIISHNFGGTSGPSIALFHALRGIAKFFDDVYIFNTISSANSYDQTLIQHVPKNVRIYNYLINIKPYTLGLSMHTLKLRMCLDFYKLLSKLEKSHSLYLLVWSDILNLTALTTCLSNRKYYVGYNVFFNFAPIDIMLKQKVNYVNYEEVSEKCIKLILSQIYRGIDLRMVRYVEHILAHTNYQKTLYNKYLGIPDPCISVIPHMVDTKFIQGFGYIESFKNRRSKEKKKLVLFGGRKSIEKGVYVAIRALRRLLNRRTCNLKLILVGATLMCKEFKELSKSIITLEKMWYSDFLRLIYLADAVLIPSQNELFGLIILESLSLGKPVIASRVGGIPEILGHNYELLVRPGDEEHLAKVLSDFCEDKVDMDVEYLVRKAERFDVSVIAPQLYTDILKHGRL